MRVNERDTQSIFIIKALYNKIKHLSVSCPYHNSQFSKKTDRDRGKTEAEYSFYLRQRVSVKCISQDIDLGENKYRFSTKTSR